jgi:hypothetical protein
MLPSGLAFGGGSFWRMPARDGFFLALRWS